MSVRGGRIGCMLGIMISNHTRTDLNILHVLYTIVKYYENSKTLSFAPRNSYVGKVRTHIYVEMFEAQFSHKIMNNANRSRDW